MSQVLFISVGVDKKTHMRLIFFPFSFFLSTSALVLHKGLATARATQSERSRGLRVTFPPTDGW